MDLTLELFATRRKSRHRLPINFWFHVSKVRQCFILILLFKRNTDWWVTTSSTVNLYVYSLMDPVNCLDSNFGHQMTCGYCGNFVFLREFDVKICAFCRCPHTGVRRQSLSIPKVAKQNVILKNLFMTIVCVFIVLNYTSYYRKHSRSLLPRRSQAYI